MKILNINIDFIGEYYLNKEYKTSIIDRFGGNNNSVPTPRATQSNIFDVTGRKHFDVSDINKQYSHVFVNHKTKEIIFSVGRLLRLTKVVHSGKYFKEHMNTKVA